MTAEVGQRVVLVNQPEGWDNPKAGALGVIERLYRRGVMVKWDGLTLTLPMSYEEIALVG